jgi:hypothetical protein
MADEKARDDVDENRQESDFGEDNNQVKKALGNGFGACSDRAANC